MSIKVRIFQALDGDCISLKYGIASNTNIIIDLGYLKTYKNTLKKEIEDIRDANEKVDLLIITHVDRDHISGLKGLIKNFHIGEFVSEAWMNNPNVFLPNSENNFISFLDGNTAIKYFINKNITCRDFLTNYIESIEGNNANITILSPSRDTLKDYLDNWIEYNKSHKISATANDWNENIDRLYNNSYEPDNSMYNKASISFIIEIESRKIMFLGDSDPIIVKDKLLSLGYSSENPIKVDLIKLAHHGGKHNICNELLEIIDCDKFIISSNGRNLSKETLSKILLKKDRYIKKKVIFYFNYSKKYYEGMFKANDMEIYNFECIYANENDNCILINLL